MHKNTGLRRDAVRNLRWVEDKEIPSVTMALQGATAFVGVPFYRGEGISWHFQAGRRHAYNRRAHRNQTTWQPDRREADGWGLGFGSVFESGRGRT